MGTTIRRQNKKGIAIFMVLFIMVVLGALMVQFHQSSRQAQNSVHRFQTSEMARQLASAGQEEAFDYLHRETGDIYDSSLNLKPIPAMIIERNPSIVLTSIGPDGRKSVKGIELQIPVTKALAGNKMEITATARISDCRDTDFKGNVFYGNERIGTIEIVVTAKAKDEYKKQFPGSCTIVKQHDYKVVTIATKKDREVGYSGSSFLDYVLFVRSGQQEFLGQPVGTSINPMDTCLEVNAESGAALGKINLGASGNFYHYINISNSNKELLPNAGETISLPELETDDSIVDRFFPAFREAVGKSIKEEVKKRDASLKSWDVRGHKAKFSYVRSPITDDAITSQELIEARENATLEAANKLGKNVPKSSNDIHYYEGIKIKPTEKYDKIFGSDIRKLFFNYGYFVLDLSNCRVSGTVKKGLGSDDFDEPIGQHADNINLKVPCYNSSVNSSGINFQELSNYIKSHGNDIASKAFTYINDEFAYTNSDASPIANNEQFYQPSVGGASSPESNPMYAHYPYSHYMLFNKRYVDNLERFGIYGYDTDNSLKLHLRGIVHCENPIVLGEANKELLVDGYGVIIAPGIHIEGAIKKNDPNSICVLFARDGNITVNTNKEIQAALIASKGPDNIESDIIANEELNLVGCLITDRLRLSNWKHGVKHKITYDSALSPRNDIYQININKRITFERVLENE